MNEKKKFNGKEELDTGVMRIMDLAHWNPKKGAALNKKVKDVDLGEESLLPVKIEENAPKVNAPQVKFDRDGNIVLDEESLIIRSTRPDTSAWETIDEDRCGRKINSNSFKKNMARKGVTWTPKETDLFYEILKCTGSDFGLMHEFYPSRARTELKAKYNREEKQHWYKIDAALKNPLAFDDSLKDRVNRLTKEIEEEAQEKLDKQNKKRKKKADTPVATIDWDESTADLVAEAEAVITELEATAHRLLQEAEEKAGKLRRSTRKRNIKQQNID